ncbi:hypothetical protein LSH36_280g02034 [Paralvinella palmiformis]|uniref:Uncharacterized protein n=1 Tax=Paralvinella palmiformis TaxID=53620 RepID=A0AAD9JKM5_9ANNE|nr:hypothetical protein LSH36_280g02034 [Paralvinella palmiformis]
MSELIDYSRSCVKRPRPRARRVVFKRGGLLTPGRSWFGCDQKREDRVKRVTTLMGLHGHSFGEYRWSSTQVVLYAAECILCDHCHLLVILLSFCLLTTSDISCHNPPPVPPPTPPPLRHKCTR